MQPTSFYIGTAAWTIPSQHKAQFPDEGSHLEKYSQRLNAVEINTSFYREHQASTYVRWSESVPEHFRFSVKLFRTFTHDKRLDLNTADEEALRINLEGIQGLGEKLGCLLVQVPPSLDYQSQTASRFFKSLRRHFEGQVCFEPRHRSWVKAESQALLRDHQISFVYADPEPFSAANALSFHAQDIQYFRLHGSPEIYKSDYEPPTLQLYQRQMLSSRANEVWCIFDNTTFGHATKNALELTEQFARLNSDQKSRLKVVNTLFHP